jgi:hypothetical protein
MHQEYANVLALADVRMDHEWQAPEGYGPRARASDLEQDRLSPAAEAADGRFSQGGPAWDDSTTE